MSEKNIRISEIFGPTIQGEGAVIGQPTVFVRTGGCDYRCTWCDTLYAVDSEYRHQWQAMSAEEIFGRVQELAKKPLMVTLSGGNPAIQPLSPLITLGKKHGYRFALETQGSVAQDWFSNLDVLTLSPKPPSSGMKTDWDVFNDCLKTAGEGPKTSLKIIIFDENDYAYAKEAAEKYSHLPIYLQPGNHTTPPQNIDKDALNERMQWLIEKVNSDQWFEASVLPQLHVMLWGNERGV
ncbi:MAG: 7-carboxy-7-deazaguanine synthase [Micavibrio sp.]|nr:MAG: 7-carboxy-7-deazaguanine synthase [Micavibrio sp.]